VIGLLERGARECPDRILVRSPNGQVTYRDVLAKVQALSAGLTAHGLGRFGCLTDDCAELITVLCAAAATGSDVCPYPVQVDDVVLAAIAQEMGHDTIVSNRHRPLAGVQLRSIDSLTGEPAAESAASDGSPPAGHLLILTTGTTGRPKATRHDWTRLLSGVATQAPGATWLTTYNPYQFAGIQVLLHVLANRASLVIPASRRPDAVMAAIRDASVTHISGTPTFWRLLTMTATDSELAELGLEQVTLGGEAASGDLLTQLRRAFTSARISQVYAATEFGSAITVTDGLPGLPVTLLERSATESHRAQIRITDGELEVRSSVGMVGYLDTDDVSDSWLPTGDLVDIVGDRILFTGRKNERINVGGAKVMPSEVEQAAYSVAGVGLAAAYARPNPITGSVVALDVVPRPGAEEADLKRRIREACAGLAPAAQPRLIRFVAELDTRGGKVSRVRPDGSGPTGEVDA
jgi:acyl-CoA synthetase (AMP-forming)/AMP-acid ligase II